MVEPARARRLPGGLPAVALDEQVSHLTALFEQSPVGMAVLDPQLRYVTVNPALAAINGVPVDAHPHRYVADSAPFLPPEVQVGLHRVLQTGEPLVGVLVRGRSATDLERDRVWETSYYRLEGVDGRPLGLSVTVEDVTAREDARRAVVAAQFRLSVVNEASARIGTTLDLDRTCRELVDVAAPRFADVAAVDLLESLLDIDAVHQHEVDGSAVVRRVAARGTGASEPTAEPAGANPAGADPAERRIVYGEHHPAAHVLARGRAVLVPAAPGTESGWGVGPGPGGASGAWPVEYRVPTAGAYLAGPGHAAEVQPDPDATRPLAAMPAVPLTSAAAPLASMLAAPLVARGQVLGVASFARTADSTPFDEQDLALAEELAARAALAIDNARLYNRERTTAVALQRSLLPQGNPPVECVQLASRYSPGSLATQVGGDWFDVVPLSCGRVALVVGDVMGRGLRAAAAMGQLRTAVRTLAVLDLMPDDVVTHLDDVAQSLDEVQLATCLYAVYDPVSRCLTWASAGHPPPALVGADGEAELLAMPSGAPLGVGGVPFESAQVTLTDESTLAFYTDGLVESRRQDLDAGLDRLCRSLAAAPRDLEPMCDAVLRGMDRDGAHDDDVALLIARVAGVDDERTEAWKVPADEAAVSQARHASAATLRGWGLSALEDTATLLVSEVVTNAIRYAREPIELRLVKLDSVLVCSVVDGDARLPRLRRSGFDDEGGRGLHLVGMLARRWGARPTDDGKSVWFELALPQPGCP